MRTNKHIPKQQLMTNAKRRLVLSSVNQVLAVIRNNQKLLNLPKFATIKNLSPSAAPKKGCNCGHKKNVALPDNTKQIIENILTSLDGNDYTQIKNTLQLDELCVYRRNVTSNNLEMVCY